MVNCEAGFTNWTTVMIDWVIYLQADLLTKSFSVCTVYVREKKLLFDWFL